MEATPSKIIDFFNGFKQSVIPLFQRQYEWAERNWETLWDDTVERYEDERDVDHFLGAIVTIPARSVPVGVSKFLVIDGQQRLTTIALLMCAIRDSLPSDAKQRNRIQRHYLFNEDYEGWDQFKLLPTQPDRAGFRALALGEDAPQPSRMRDAYAYFCKKIAAKDSEGNAIDAVRLLETVEQRLMVVSINLGDSDDPYLIFESLNFKGSPLTQADLVRNYFLMRFPTTEQESVYQALWLPMEARLGEHLTEFMRVCLMQDGAEVRKGEIYRELKRRLQELDGVGVRRELQRMHDLSKSYLALVDPSKEPDPAVRRRLAIASRLEVATSHPLLLRIHDRYRRGEVSAEELDKFIAVIESYAIRRFFCDVPTNQLKKIYLGLAKTYVDESPAAWLADKLAPGLYGRRWPRDDEFRTAWRQFPLYLRRERCRLVLELLELDHGHKEQADLENASIEHVLPQTLSDWWRDHLGDDREVHSAVLHTVGNLTLTCYNAELSNDTLAEKQETLAQSHFSLNAHFAGLSAWRRAEIEGRAELLFARALRLWPGPVGPAAQE